MKVLFNCHVPFSLAHGGAQIQIEQTMRGLQQVGVDAEPLRWWDDTQTGDILHHVGRLPVHLLDLAHEKHMGVVMAPLLSGVGARSAWKRWAQRTVIGGARALAPNADAFNWKSWQLADACVALTPYEASLMTDIFRAPPDRVHVVTNGVEREFLDSAPAERGKWLVCTATIIPLKQVQKVAEMAVQAKTPIWFIGRPYSESDSYSQAFLAFAKRNPEWIRFEGPVNQREQLARIYRAARGFVLLSQWESLSLSALEAAACGCPLFLSDLPWARDTFKDKATYCPHNAPVSACAEALRRFYDAAPTLPVPPKPLSWLEVAGQLKRIYETILARR